MSIRTGLLVLCAAVLVLIGGSLYMASRALGTQTDIALAEARRHHSSRLADELRQSSDDLTRMAGLYVVTGDARYKTYFERILAIRDGKAPRPIDYGNVYWDFVVAWGKPPRRDGQAAALERLMREARFTDDELAFLQQAKHRSDALVALESRAMRAVEGRFQDPRGEFTVAGAPDLELARRLMHGPEYHLAKAEIMSPIHDFLGRVDSRTAAEVGQLRRHGQRLNAVVIFGLGTAVVLVLISFALVARYPFAPLAPRSGPVSVAAEPAWSRGAVVWTAWPLLAAALAASGAVLALSWWLSATITDRIRGDVRSGLEAVHQATARAVDDWLAGVDRDARTWAQSPVVRTPPAAARAGESRAPAPRRMTPSAGPPIDRPPIKKTPSLVAYAILDREGRVVAGDDSGTRSGSGKLLSELRASPQHSLVTFRAGRDAASAGPEVLVAAGVPDERGGIDGALVLRLDPRVELSRLLQRGHLGESGETYAFTRAGGRVIERESGEPVAAGVAPPAFTRMTRAALAGYSGMDVDGYRDARGVPVVGAWTWNERYGIGIATEVKTAEAYGALGEYLRQTRWGAGLSVALILGLGGVFAWNRMAMAAAGAKLETAYEIIRGHRDRMETELNVGRDLQLSMLPRAVPAFADRDDVSVHATLRPAREVAGDFYDYYFVGGGHVFFCIGDVSDKGVAAALFMAVATTLIRTRTADDASPASVVAYLNAELSRDNDRCMFVTLFAGRLDVASGELVYTNAGHEPPLVRSADGSIAWVDERHGPLVGVAPRAVYGESRRRLAPGDCLLAYTDGVTEARAAHGALFSEERILAVMRAGGPMSGEALVERLLAEVEAFAHGAEPSDDIAVLAVQFRPGAATELVETIVIRDRMSELGRVADMLDRFGDDTRLPVDTMADLRVVCDEILSNVIAYAFPERAGEHDIELRLAMAGGRLTVRVSDAGWPFDPSTAPAPNLETPLAQREIGGLGIHLMRTLFDEMAYERRDDHNVLTLTKHVAAHA